MEDQAENAEEKIEDKPVEQANENDVVEGTVCGVTNFGAFVKLSNGQEGLVHISEISPSFVKNVGDFLRVGQTIEVKVLGTNKRGKLDLSIKKINPNLQQMAEDQKEKKAPRKEINPEDFYPKTRSKPSLNSLEDKIGFFIKRSDEKLLDIRKNVQAKQGVPKRKKLGKQ